MDNQRKIEQAIKNKNQRIDSFVDRKEKSIAFFSSVKAAIEMADKFPLKRPGKTLEVKEMKEEIIYWRDWFYDEWRDWYLNNIIPMKDKPYNVSVAAKKRIVDDLKAQDTEGHFKEDEKLKNQRAESEYFNQPPEQV